jgi:hypothetical protein
VSAADRSPWSSNKLAHSAREAYERLRVLAADFSRWAATPTGADLWVDGLDAISSTPAPAFEVYLQHLVDGLGNARCEPGEWNHFVAGCQLFLQHCRSDSEAAFWHGLACVLSCFEVSGGPPKISSTDVAIVNDTLLYLLSPQHRSIRHIALFSRDYFFASTEEQAAERIVDIEEATVSVDLLTVRDLVRWRIDLRCLRDYASATSSSEWTPSGNLMTRAATTPELSKRLQVGLRETARRACRFSDESGSLEPGHLHEWYDPSWIPPTDLRAHVLDARLMARRLMVPETGRVSREFGDLASESSLLNRPYWESGSLILDTVDILNPQARASGLLRNTARCLAEFAVEVTNTTRSNAVRAECLEALSVILSAHRERESRSPVLFKSALERELSRLRSLTASEPGLQTRQLKRAASALRCSSIMLRGFL